MKFEDDDLKDGKLWAALQKEIDRDLAERRAVKHSRKNWQTSKTPLNLKAKKQKAKITSRMRLQI